MSPNEIDDVQDLVARLLREALAAHMQPTIAAAAARGGLKADAERIRECIGELRRRPEGA